VRRFVVLGRSALASGEFSLDDLPGTSGRLDVLLRCVRAALLHSHGIRHDTVIYLVLEGGHRAPRTVRVDGASAKFVRPDERPLATLLKKVLSSDADESHAGFVDVRPGIALAKGGLEIVLEETRGSPKYVLEENAQDIRGVEFDSHDGVFVLGDHLGFDERTRAQLVSLGAKAISVGPLSLHTDDVVAIVQNELDRRE
jgi:tRNA (pseudouridine54-N1)-methyltransferase